MDNTLERVVRDLIREGYLSRARALLSLFQGEYPHLRLELEAAAGNWKAVMKIYETLSEDKKAEYQTLYKTAKDRFKGDYTEDIIDALQETERGNFEGSIAALEAVSKSYPELVEVIALKLEIARKKKDRERVRIFEETLRKLDPSHPVLTKHEKTVRSMLLDWMILTAVLISLALSVFGLFRPSTMEKNLAEVRNQVSTLSARIENVDRAINSTYNELSGIKSQLASVTDLQTQVQNLGTDFRNLEGFVAKSIEDLKDFIVKENQELLSKVQMPGRGIYPSSMFAISDVSIETLRSFWLTGYRLYRERKYSDAFNVLYAVFSALKDKEAYFKDDVFYYLALVAHESGDLEKAKKLFEEFISNFPDSIYAPHARYFIKKTE